MTKQGSLGSTARKKFNLDNVLLGTSITFFAAAIALGTTVKPVPNPITRIENLAVQDAGVKGPVTREERDEFVDEFLNFYGMQVVYTNENGRTQTTILDNGDPIEWYDANLLVNSYARYKLGIE